MKFKGINYDTGIRTIRGGVTRATFDPAIVEKEIDLIKNELHCNAIRISGLHLDRMEKAEGKIKKAMQIGAVQTTASSWLQPGTSSETGARIDLLLDRADQCINICEIKFSNQPFAIDKKYARELEQKVTAFRQNTRSRKTLFLTFITTYGLSNTIYKEQLADADVNMDSLFG